MGSYNLNMAPPSLVSCWKRSILHKQKSVELKNSIFFAKATIEARCGKRLEPLIEADMISNSIRKANLLNDPVTDSVYQEKNYLIFLIFFLQNWTDYTNSFDSFKKKLKLVSCDTTVLIVESFSLFEDIFFQLRADKTHWAGTGKTIQFLSVGVFTSDVWTALKQSLATAPLKASNLKKNQVGIFSANF